MEGEDMFTSRLAALTFAGVLAVGLAGCGNGSSNNGSGTAADSSTVKVGTSSLGAVLTDGAGLTLYLYTPDGKNVSNCTGGCLAQWPVFEGKPAAGDGADAALIGTTTRNDGTTQATYAGHPLYYYALDKSAGDVAGQGVGNVWYALDATGSPVKAVPANPGGGGY
jgi:predicted lipoprotein with Yx(FWY)xxD motif